MLETLQTNQDNTSKFDISFETAFEQLNNVDSGWVSLDDLNKLRYNLYELTEELEKNKREMQDLINNWNKLANHVDDYIKIYDEIKDAINNTIIPGIEKFIDEDLSNLLDDASGTLSSLLHFAKNIDEQSDVLKKNLEDLSNNVKTITEVKDAILSWLDLLDLYMRNLQSSIDSINDLLAQEDEIIDFAGDLQTINFQSEILQDKTKSDALLKTVGIVCENLKDFEGQHNNELVKDKHYQDLMLVCLDLYNKISLQENTQDDLFKKFWKWESFIKNFYNFLVETVESSKNLEELKLVKINVDKKFKDWFDRIWEWIEANLFLWAKTEIADNGNKTIVIKNRSRSAIGRKRQQVVHRISVDESGERIVHNLYYNWKDKPVVLYVPYEDIEWIDSLFNFMEEKIQKIEKKVLRR